jgi:hypothetical protein
VKLLLGSSMHKCNGIEKEAEDFIRALQISEGTQTRRIAEEWRLLGCYAVWLL